MELNKIISLLRIGEVGVIPTDTIYGIVGSALNAQTVEKIYQLRKRSLDKPMIILISSLEDLKKFEIEITDRQAEILNTLWPNPVSVILPCLNKNFEYLHRGKKALAFRMPKNKWLFDLLKQTGPLVAPSANLEGEPSSETIEQAKSYFGNDISFYYDAGVTKGQPSTLISIDGENINILRQGSFKIQSF